MTVTTDSGERLRTHPEERFAAPEIKADLQIEIVRLRSEPHAGEAGHRQETLYHRDGLTIALFAFDRFTRLPEHRANGIVHIHVLRGSFKITTEKGVHELGAGQMLILAPGIQHAVAAEDEGEILLTVQLVGG